MYGSIAAAKQHPSRMFETGAADAAAVAAGAPLAFDMTKVADGSTVDAQGQLIEDDMSISTYVRTPSATHKYFAGLAEKAFVNAGDHQRYVVGGPTTALVHNPDAGASLTLPVGTLLGLVAGQAYLEPHIGRNAASTANVLLDRPANPVAMVRKAVTLTSGQTASVQVFAWIPRAPQPFTLTFPFAGAAPTAGVVAAMPVHVTRGPGWISAVGFSCMTGGGAGSLTLDALIDATSIFTTQPVIVNDCVDPFISLVTTAVPGSGTGPGTAGSYGLINSAANTFAKRQIITLTLTNASSFVGTGVCVQIDGYYW